MKKRDIILISVILIVAIASLLVIKLTQKEGAVVAVSVNGETIAEFPLDKDGEYSLNGGTNKLKIENGEAWMVDANCPTSGDTKCTHQGKISKTGQKITCLPNKLVVNVIGADAEGDGEVDLIS